VRRPGYANVVATLALVVAMGGTSYAAVKITGKDVKNSSLSGKDVKNESLTGLDVKKQSVPLDRLSGSLPTQLDPGQFVPSAGLYTVSVGPSAWEALGTGLARTNTFGRWTSTTASGTTTVMLDPALPTTIAGKPMRLRAVTPCWDATLDADILITAVFVTTWRQDASATITDAIELADENDHTEKICKRFEFTTPVGLASNSRAGLRVSVGWNGMGVPITLGGATFELDRA
jgi:hypothetical protein